MKNLTLLFGFLMLLFSAYTQEPVKTITINFKDSDVFIEDINNGDFYKVVITDINLNLYKVTISSKDTLISKPQATPTFADINLSAVSSAMAGISSFTAVSSRLDAASDALIKATVYSAIARDDIKVRMNIEKQNLTNAKLDGEKIITRIDELKFNAYQVKLNSQLLQNTKSSFNFTNALIEAENIRQKIVELKDSINSRFESYNRFSDTNAVAMAKPEYNKNDKAIKDTYLKFISFLSEASAAISAEKVNELLSSLVFIQNNSENSYTSLPMQFLGEQAKVKITITPRDEKLNLQSYSTTITFPENIRKYAVVGISFYGSNLYDSAYSVVETKTSDTTSIFNFVPESLPIHTEIGISATLRYGIKLNKTNNFGAHLCLGAGIPISTKVKPRVLVGGGISIGDKHMIASDAGLIFGLVDRISTSINLNENYSSAPENLTVSKLGAGAFLSIGYTYQF